MRIIIAALYGDLTNCLKCSIVGKEVTIGSVDSYTEYNYPSGCDAYNSMIISLEIIYDETALNSTSHGISVFNSYNLEIERGKNGFSIVSRNANFTSKKCYVNFLKFK